MLTENQAKKNKPSTKMAGKREKTKTPKTLTPKQIAIITGSDPQPVKDLSPEEMMFQNLLNKFFELLKIFHESGERVDEYLSGQDLMKIFGIKSKSTFNTWLNEKGLPHYKVKTKVVVKKIDFQEFLKPYRKMGTFRKAAKMLIIVSSNLLSDAGDVLMSVC